MKPSVTLEFDLADVRFMKPAIHTAKATVGGTVTSDTLLIRDRSWSPSVAIYVVIGGNQVIPIAIPDDTTVTLEVAE